MEEELARGRGTATVIHPLFPEAFWLSLGWRQRHRWVAFRLCLQGAPGSQGDTAVMIHALLLEDPQAQYRVRGLPRPLLVFLFASPGIICFYALLLHWLVTHAFCFPSGVLRIVRVFLFLKRNNPPRIKRSESKKEETVKGLSATWAPSYPDVFLTCIQHSLVETLYPFIKQAGVDTTPWLFYTNRSLLHARCSCFFSPVLSYRFVQAQHPHSWGYIVWLWQMMLPVLYHWLLGLQTFRGLCRVVVSILMYACFLTHVRLSADSLDSLFLFMQLHVQRKQEN